MKKVYLFMLVGVLAIVMIIVSLMDFNPKVETWSSLFAGAGVAFLLVKMPEIIAYFKSRKQNSTK